MMFGIQDIVVIYLKEMSDKGRISRFLCGAILATRARTRRVLHSYGDLSALTIPGSYQELWSQ
jgi:hypothetical protein